MTGTSYKLMWTKNQGEALRLVVDIVMVVL